MANDNAKEVHTYMSYGLPVDPAKVFTLVDLDFSYALASTLVDWGPRKELVSGLADNWASHNDKEVTFHIRSNAKWSDGTTITAKDVVASFERAKELYRSDLKSLFDLVASIEAKDADSVVFKLNVPYETSGIIKKLTEPMYGIVATNSDGSLDLGRSSGAYRLADASQSELKFMRNPQWYKAQPRMAEQIIVRQPPKGEELQAGFLKDTWVNLLTTSSLSPESLKRQYSDAHFTTWNRSLDKVFFISPSPRIANEDGRSLVRALNDKMNRATLSQGMSGLQLSDQFFVPGYVLYDSEFAKKVGGNAIPDAFRKRPLEILGIESRLGELLISNLSKAIKDVTGVAPEFKTVALGDLDKVRAQGKYDLFVASLPVNDENVEGALGYIFGMTPPFIPNAGESGKDNFHKRISNAKVFSEQSQRNAEYRQVFSDAINAGCILPLFHFSTIVIAKAGLDLSSVPSSDETVAFSKVRIK